MAINRSIVHICKTPLKLNRKLALAVNKMKVREERNSENAFKGV